MIEDKLILEIGSKDTPFNTDQYDLEIGENVSDILNDCGFADYAILYLCCSWDNSKKQIICKFKFKKCQWVVDFS